MHLNVVTFHQMVIVENEGRALCGIGLGKFLGRVKLKLRAPTFIWIVEQLNFSVVVFQPEMCN